MSDLRPNFAAAALLYLAAEELLKEAHQVEEALLSTALFLAAFLALLVIGHGRRVTRVAPGDKFQDRHDRGAER